MLILNKKKMKRKKRRRKQSKLSQLNSKELTKINQSG